MSAETITPEELKKKVKDVFLIDVRESDESGQIIGAIRVPLGKMIRDCQKLNLPTDKDIVCYCAAGFRGQMAADFLKSKGYKAKNLVGGYKAYSALSV
ncbi:MAG: rhodanese-like domain-containing protein [Candidatus Aenigmarchaeota archaeon]|nr:rhodanese-like domain-containing protein [Candidatus Aenigmarchaeota archaeon]